ncbi:hypothetical protein DMN91_009737 [Ooceraea biroi]|uniref:Uncharacterized protein n=1 Tax=Ooceraea biroi TaxID=2015173 RepID=A0A3L8DBI5_OOCBI|nr:hypothetical protein DMN91_009737 [Ooceraea biroi]
MACSFGDGVNFPERLCNEDTHTLLGHGTQQWGDETEFDSPPPYVNQVLHRSTIEQMTMIEEATILALGTGTAVIGPSVDVEQPLVNNTESV